MPSAEKTSVAVNILNELDVLPPPSEFRSHLGASVIGKPCLRALYYHWNWFLAEQIPARIRRLFDDGHEIEAKMRALIKSRGGRFLDSADTGEQTRVSALEGHYGGSVDGILIWEAVGLAEPVLFECKSANQDSFADTKKHGVKKSKPEHFGQMCTYGGLLKLKQALYLVYNKNNSEIYVELVDLEDEEAYKNTLKAEFVILNNNLPDRISKNPAYYICKQCSYTSICHGTAQPKPNCRNCKKCSPAANATFHCAEYDAIIPKEALIQGCAKHEFKQW